MQQIAHLRSIPFQMPTLSSGTLLVSRKLLSVCSTKSFSSQCANSAAFGAWARTIPNLLSRPQLEAITSSRISCHLSGSQAAIPQRRMPRLCAWYPSQGVHILKHGNSWCQNQPPPPPPSNSQTHSLLSLIVIVPDAN